MKISSKISTALIIFSLFLTCLVPPVSDLKTLLPANIYVKQLWGFVIFEIAYNILFLLLLARNVFPIGQDTPLWKKISLFSIIIIIDIIVITGNL